MRNRYYQLAKLVYKSSADDVIQYAKIFRFLYHIWSKKIKARFEVECPAGESLPCQSKRKQLGLLRHRRKHEISPLLPQAGRGSVAPRITLDNWHRVKNIGVAKSWDKNYRKKEKLSGDDNSLDKRVRSAA